MFTQIPVNIKNAHLLFDCYLIQGDYESDSSLWIGRINYSGNVIIGKVFPSWHRYAGMELFHNEEHRDKIKEFEILAYGCDHVNVLQINNKSLGIFILRYFVYD